METAVGILISLLGVALLGSAGYVLVLAVRAKHPEEEWAVVGFHVSLRAGAGVAALWLAFGGGAIAGWTMVGLLIAHLAWREIARRQHVA